MVLKHTDDDGDLSIFVSGDELLVACNKGHYWLIEAEEKAIAGAKQFDVVETRFGAGAALYLRGE